MTSGVGGAPSPGGAFPAGAADGVKGAQLGKTAQLKQVRSVRDSITKAPSSSRPTEQANQPRMQKPKSDTPFPQALKRWQGNRQAYKENPASREIEQLKREAKAAMEEFARSLNDHKVGVMTEKSFGRATTKYLDFKQTWEDKWNQAAQSFNRGTEDPSQRLEEFLKLPEVKGFKPAGPSGFYFKPKIPELIPVQQSRFETLGEE